jgi:hypothetical protein
MAEIRQAAHEVGHAPPEHGVFVAQRIELVGCRSLFDGGLDAVIDELDAGGVLGAGRLRPSFSVSLAPVSEIFRIWQSIAERPPLKMARAPRIVRTRSARAGVLFSTTVSCSRLMNVTYNLT